ISWSDVAQTVYPRASPSDVLPFRCHARFGGCSAFANALKNAVRYRQLYPAPHALTVTFHVAARTAHLRRSPTRQNEWLTAHQFLQLAAQGNQTTDLFTAVSHRGGGHWLLLGECHCFFRRPARPRQSGPAGARPPKGENTPAFVEVLGSEPGQGPEMPILEVGAEG